MPELYEQIPCEHPEATGPHTTDGTHRRWLVNPPDAVCGGPSYKPVDPVAVVRRGVESGEIEGEVVEASYDDDWLASDYSLPVAKAGVYVVVGPVSLNEQKAEGQ